MRELGIPVVVAAPLGRGLLTSTFSAGETGSDPNDMRPKVFPRFLPENHDQNVTTVGKFRTLADVCLVFFLKSCPNRYAL